MLCTSGLASFRVAPAAAAHGRRGVSLSQAVYITVLPPLRVTYRELRYVV